MLFNSSLMRESRALSFVSRLIDNSNIPEGTRRKIQLHSDVSRHVVARLGVASKQARCELAFLKKLHDLGGKTMDA
jgi:NTE family protein